MGMGGRDYYSKLHRFGMNGQIKDDEIVLGQFYSAEYWEYNNRLARRWNTDPDIRAWESSYSCFLSNPIYYTDPTGEAPPEKNSKVEKFKNWISGNSYKNEANQFAVENSIDESLISYNKKGHTVDITQVRSEKIGVNENGESIYELQESVISFRQNGSVTQSTYTSTCSLPLYDILYQPEKEYDTGPDVGLSPLFTVKNLRDLGKISKLAQLGRTSLKMTLPSWKKVTIDMEEILSGHTIGGSRVSKLKDLFPESFTATQVENTVRSAYKNVHSKLYTQGERILLQGTADNGIKVEMWLNKSTKTIETAYPK